MCKVIHLDPTRFYGYDDVAVPDLCCDMINLAIMWLLILERTLEDGDIQESQAIVTHILEELYGHRK